MTATADEASAAADLINYLRAADAPPIDATVETVADLIIGAPPACKKVLMAAIGKAYVASEKKRLAGKRKPVEKSTA